MRLRGSVLVLILVLALVPALGAPWAGADGAETAIVVTTEAEYRAALTTLSGDASGPHTITLGADIVLAGAADPAYSGPQPLTIEGQGFALDGGGNGRVLYRITSAPLLTLNDVIVRNAQADGIGGAIRWAGAVSITGSQFLANVVSGAGLQSGAGVYSSGDVSVTDSVFIENRATSTTSNASGGGVYASGGFTALRSVFDGNRAESPAATANSGAALVIGATTVTDSVFVHNTAEGMTAIAGAVRPGPAPTATVTRSWFWDNTALGVADGTGGALWSFGAVEIADSTLEENAATASAGTARGGAVTAGAVTLEDSTVTETLTEGSSDSYAAVSAETATVTGDHATIARNEGATVANVEAATLAGTALVIGDPIGGPNCALSGATTATDSVDDDGTCGGDGNQSDVDTIGLGPVRDNGGPGIPAATFGPEAPPEAITDAYPARTQYPLAGSPVLDVVAPGDCADTLDGRQVDRPFGTGCEAGASEGVFPPHGFSDVPVWVEDAVRWLASDVQVLPLITGYANGTFRPGDPITRGQVVRMLHREAGAPDGYPGHGFSDVPGWVDDAVRWATAEGIATGYQNGTFRPNEPITRAQVVRMKYRLAGSPSVAGLPPHGFSDVPAWVQDPVRWAANVDNPLPLITGYQNGTFRPDLDITRGQVARMDYRLAITPGAWADPSTAPDTLPFSGGFNP